MLDIRIKSSFTLLEITIVVVIVGILAALALPRYLQAVESTMAREAISSLEQIKAGEIIYRAEENTYWPAGTTENNIDQINFRLRLSLDTRELNWDYSVNAGSNPPGNTFTATTTRTGGVGHGGETIIFDENGLDKTSSTWSGPWP